MLPLAHLPLNELFSRVGQLNTLLHLKCADLLITLFCPSRVPCYFFPNLELEDVFTCITSKLSANYGINSQLIDCDEFNHSDGYPLETEDV